MNQENVRNRRVGAALAVMFTCVGIVGTYSAHAALPHNPIHLPKEKEIGMNLLLPQGWKFFTRDPQEEKFFVLRRVGTGWAPLEYLPNGSMSNVFGARRSGRAQAIEFGRIAGDLPKKLWHECTEAPEICVDRAPLAEVAIKNARPDPTMCGELAVFQQKPIPWAWGALENGVVMPSRVVRVEIQC